MPDLCSLIAAALTFGAFMLLVDFVVREYRQHDDDDPPSPSGA